MLILGEKHSKLLYTNNKNNQNAALRYSSNTSSSGGRVLYLSISVALR